MFFVVVRIGEREECSFDIDGPQVAAARCRCIVDCIRDFTAPARPSLIRGDGVLVHGNMVIAGRKDVRQRKEIAVARDSSDLLVQNGIPRRVQEHQDLGRERHAETRQPYIVDTTEQSRPGWIFIQVDEVTQHGVVVVNLPPKFRCFGFCEGCLSPSPVQHVGQSVLHFAPMPATQQPSYVSFDDQHAAPAGCSDDPVATWLELTGDRREVVGPNGLAQEDGVIVQRKSRHRSIGCYLPAPPPTRRSRLPTSRTSAAPTPAPVTPARRRPA